MAVGQLQGIGTGNSSCPGKEQAFGFDKIGDGLVQIESFSTQVLQEDMTKFKDPKGRKLPIFVRSPPLLNFGGVFRRRKQLDQHIGIGHQHQDSGLMRKPKRSSSGGWRSLSMAAMISSLVMLTLISKDLTTGHVNTELQRSCPRSCLH